MSFSSAVSELFKKEQAVAESAADHLAHPTLTSTRLWVTVGFGAALVWLTKGVLTETNIICLSAVACVYLITNTMSRVAQIKANGAIRTVGSGEPTKPE
jgi:hypothetical protein